ncbi:TPA: hypothetical protein QDB23_000274 [Burkholderia vietnamiensis]|nr:hypothetical protein [Burkholderia vietnamiensis]
MLTSEQRTELEAVMRKRHDNAALARRARCVLRAALGRYGAPGRYSIQACLQ